MNIYVIFIFLAIIAIFILIVLENFRKQSSYRDNKTFSPSVNGVYGDTSQLDKCVFNPEDYKVLNNLQKCVGSDGADNGEYLYILGTQKFLIANAPTYYLTACRSACTEGVSGDSCVDEKGQTQFEQCLELTKPTNCKASALPIGKLPTSLGLDTLYYIKQYDGDCRLD